MSTDIFHQHPAMVIGLFEDRPRGTRFSRRHPPRLRQERHQYRHGRRYAHAMVSATPGTVSGLAEKAAEHGELGGPLGGTLGTISPQSLPSVRSCCSRSRALW
jgi:hypothetical protein